MRTMQLQRTRISSGYDGVRPAPTINRLLPLKAGRRRNKSSRPKRKTEEKSGVEGRLQGKALILKGEEAAHIPKCYEVAHMPKGYKAAHMPLIHQSHPLNTKTNKGQKHRDSSGHTETFRAQSLHIARPEFWHTPEIRISIPQQSIVPTHKDHNFEAMVLRVRRHLHNAIRSMRFMRRGNHAAQLRR